MSISKAPGLVVVFVFFDTRVHWLNNFKGLPQNHQENAVTKIVHTTEASIYKF